MSPSLYDLDPGPAFPEVVRMVAEILKGSSNKFEYDRKLGAFRPDRVLYSRVHYPGDYGFIPGTLASDVGRTPASAPDPWSGLWQLTRMGGRCGRRPRDWGPALPC